MPIIKNAGYMWHRRYVNWQSGDKLMGVLEFKQGKAVNFAYQAGIYALYDKDFKCVYVGQAGRGEIKGLYHRLKDHAISDHLFCRWERFSWYGFYSVKSLEARNKGDVGSNTTLHCKRKNLNHCSPRRIPVQTEIDIAEWEE